MLLWSAVTREEEKNTLPLPPLAGYFSRTGVKFWTQTYIRHVIDYIYKGLISATCEAVVHFQGSFVLLSFGSEMKWEDLLNVPHPPSL